MLLAYRTKFCIISPDAGRAWRRKEKAAVCGLFFAPVDAAGNGLDSRRTHRGWFTDAAACQRHSKQE